MGWKTAFRSIYYDGAPEPADRALPWAETALLIIDVQNTYLARPDRASLAKAEQRRYDAWTPFHQRMNAIVLPNLRRLLQVFRSNRIECLFARIACHTKTTDSALTGTNLRLILHNLGVKNVVCAGIFTDQCISSTVRSLADESYNVLVVEDCCAAGSDELHRKELEIINMIYCHVVSSSELIAMMGLK